MSLELGDIVTITNIAIVGHGRFFVIDEKHGVENCFDYSYKLKEIDSADNKCFKKYSYYEDELKLIRTKESIQYESDINPFEDIESIQRNTAFLFLNNKISSDTIKMWKSREHNEPIPYEPEPVRFGKNLFNVNLFNKECIQGKTYQLPLEEKATPYEYYKDISEMQVKMDNLEKQVNNIKIKKEEENNMLKILDIYKEKKTREIEEKYDKQIEELISNDEVQVFIKQAEETIKSMLDTENAKVFLSSDVVEYTQETIDKKQEIINIIRNEKNKLNKKIDEIQALLELAPNYEEKIRILRDYDIMDKKKNIIL